MTIRDAIGPMPRPISVRLDDDALRALKRLESSGRSRSEAIRPAVINEARRLDDRRALRDDYLRLADDPDDRAEMADVANLMEALRAPR